MADTYSKLLVRANGSTFPPAGPPSGFRWIVRDICLDIPGGAAKTIVGLSDSVGITFLSWVFEAILDPASAHFDMRQVLDYPDTLIGISAPTAINWRISGYELSLP